MPRKPAQPRTKEDLATAPKTKAIMPAEIPIGVMKLGLVGRSPLLFHRKAQKVWQELLLPAPTKRKRVDRLGILKHNPLEEFRDSIYRSRNPKNPTLLLFPASAVRRAIASVALDMPGLAKTEIGRWVWVEGVPIGKRHTPESLKMLNIYGAPLLAMDMVRNYGMNRTPDVRCKAIVPEWCCEIVVNFAQPNLTRNGVISLLSNAGKLIGIGDGRQEKGILSNGQWRVVGEGDKEFARIQASTTYASQLAAMETPEFYDEQSEEMYLWFDEELERRRQAGEAPEVEEDEPELETED